jgi:hypothetical protein
MKKSKSASVKPSGKFVIGRSRFAKISAVEGLRITAAMETEFRDFDRRGLSAQERRKIIANKYGKWR